MTRRFFQSKMKHKANWTVILCCGHTRLSSLTKFKSIVLHFWLKRASQITFYLNSKIISLKIIFNPANTKSIKCYCVQFVVCIEHRDT
uniref:Uncharacterized protein n=1 Tax=Rhizophora mucronata TaxID=61149 RepID=A0A2P2QJ76_RHIMU